MSQQQFGPLEIDNSTIHPIKEIEINHLYKIFEGIWKNTIPNAIYMPRNGSISDFFKEVELMKQLKHSSILKLYGVCTKEKPMCIITEQLDVGNLHTYLKIKGNCLQESHLIDVGAHIASGMAYLESKNCVHQNLHAKNVYLKTELTQRLICKVTNFSYAWIISENNGVKTVPSETFPIKWTAPEILKSGIFTLKSDVWSFGIVLYELVTLGHIPYPGVPNVTGPAKRDQVGTNYT